MDLTTDQFAIIAAIVGGSFAITNSALKLLSDWITSKYVPYRNTQSSSSSTKCKFENSQINTLVMTQNANIAELLKHNAAMINAMKEGMHAAELRHQIVLTKLEQILENIRSHTTK
jgi:hypothetical protein